MNSTTVFNFSDYRSFLKAYADKKRISHSHWSFGVWARQLKLAGTSSLTMIINGDRQPGSEITSKLTQYFKFNEKEKLYFEDLIRLEKVKNDTRLKVVLMEELKKLNPQKKFELMDSKTFESVSRWYFYAIRQATRLPQFKNNPTWIKENLSFNLSEAQIQKTVKTLLELDLLRIDKNKKIKIAQGAVRTTDDISSEAIRRFHEDVLLLSQQSVRKFSVDERVLQATTLAFDKAQMPKAKELMRKFAEDMSSLSSENGDAVYQMSTQFFPVLQIKNKGYQNE